MLAETAPGTRIMVPSKAECQQRRREGARSRIPSHNQTVEPSADLSSGTHWGWIHQRGMEHESALKEHSVALGKAKAFLAKQPLAARFAKRAFMVDADDHIEVSFISLSITGASLPPPTSGAASPWWGDGAENKAGTFSVVCSGGGIAIAMQTDQYPGWPLKAPPNGGK